MIGRAYLPNLLVARREYGKGLGSGAVSLSNVISTYYYSFFFVLGIAGGL